MATIKYIHVRFPGNDLIHLLVPEGPVELDQRFGDDGHTFYDGFGRTRCGRWHKGFIVDGQGERCHLCFGGRTGN